MKVTVTSQTHPLYGQQFDIDDVSFNGKNLEIALQLQSGERLTIASDLTDYGKVSDNLPKDKLHLLDIECLRKIVKVVGQIKEEAFE